jgi:hypothetical protein
MASGAMVHPCEFFLFCILQRMCFGTTQLSGKVFSPAKELGPVFNLYSLILEYVSMDSMGFEGDDGIDEGTVNFYGRGGGQCD